MGFRRVGGRDCVCGVMFGPCSLGRSSRGRLG